LTINISIKDGVTLAVALVGAALGIFNTVRGVSRDRPRLRVCAKRFVTSYGDDGLCIEVVNCGAVSVSVSQVGFEVSKPRGHIFVFHPLPLGVQEFPHLLQPGTKMDVYLGGIAQQHPSLRRATRPFARTATGGTFRGGRRAVRDYLAQLPTARENEQ
jgi:hypothetical protein